MDTVINFKTESKVKNSAQKIAKEMGVSLSGVLNIYLREFIRSKTLYINLDDSEKLLNKLKESEKSGESPMFSDGETAVKWVRNQVK